MFKLASLSLFALFTVRAQDIIGAQGQDCTPSDDDVPEKPKCTVDATFSNTPKVECGDDFDCCLCGELICSPDCDEFVAGGDKSAFFVPSIIIYGNDDSGAQIGCGGDESCQGAVITGTNIKGIKCGGDNSCEYATINAQCINPCKLECDGDASCKEATIEVQNVEEVSCDDEACYAATIKVTQPDDNFKLECGAAQACANAHITVVTGINGKIKTIDCGGWESCKDAVITIKNEGSNQVVIEEIKCDAEDACENATIIVYGNVVVQECECSTNSCEGLTTVGFTCNTMTVE